MESNFVKNLLSPIMVNNSIHIPEWVKRIKIDVGTSNNAPFSEFWINDNNETCVFAFEPNTYNIQDLKNGGSGNPNKLNINKIGNSFFYINCALSNYISESSDFYSADGDGGTSSLFEPTDKGILVKKVIKIPVITLESFFDFFPWEKIKYIEQIKIDAQGSDFNILKGCGKYLKDSVVYIDIETSSEGYYKVEENPIDIKVYLESLGYECVKWGLDATFFNTRFNSIKNKINYKTLH